MYASAEVLDQHLGGMESTLKKIVHDYNHSRQPPSSSSGGGGDYGVAGLDAAHGNNASAKIVAILNR